MKIKQFGSTKSVFMRIKTEKQQIILGASFEEFNLKRLDTSIELFNYVLFFI